jgi:hypothetical protein
VSINTLQTICVFCASSTKVEAFYIEEAAAVGGLIAAAGKHLVYGGGHNGLMGATADGALKAGGKVTGVMPDFLVQREALHKGLTENHVVQTMHERQMIMYNLSDAFVILPGGLGTLAEFFEVLTWKQLGQHQKPIVILNAYGYWNKLLDFLSHARTENFTYHNEGELWDVVENLEGLKSVLGLR